MKYLPKTTGDTSALLGHNFDSCDRQHYTQYCPITNNRFTSRPELAVLYRTILHVFGGFQLLDLIIPELKSHVIPYKFNALIGGKFICKKKILYKICSPV